MARPATVILGVGLVLAASCGNGNPSSSCDLPRQETLDPASGLHVTPLQLDTVRYLSDPPTSGPHLGTPPATGVQERPLDPAAQVTVLESGRVLLQYAAAPPDDDLQVAAIAMANDRVVVAPNPDLPSRIVVTAWSWKMTCDAVDTAAIDSFVGERSNLDGFGDQAR